MSVLPFRDAVLVKLRRIFLPLFGLALGFAALYGALNWLLVLRTGWLPLDEDVAQYWLPLGLGWLAEIILIQPRLRSLQLNEKRQMPAIYHLLAVAAVAGPAVLTQMALQSATATFAHVETASEIAAAARSRYYTVGDPCLSPAHAQAHSTAETSGTRDETLIFKLYVAIPVCDGKGGASRTVWVGRTYEKRVASSLPDKEQEAAYAAFARETERAIDDEDLGSYKVLERLGFNQDRRIFEKAVRDGHIDPTGVIVLMPHDGDFASNRFGMAKAALAAFVFAAVIWVGLLLLTPLDPAPKPLGESMLRATFIPQRTFYGLPLLIDVNVVVFLAMALSGLGFSAFQTDDLLAWGASYGPALHGWGWLRLLTPQFVHAGLVHLGSNMYGLIFGAAFLAPVLSNWRLIAAYVVCGVGGTAASVWLHPDVVGVGASGAIFGLFGILLTLLLLKDRRITVARKPILMNAAIFVVINLAAGAASYGIDNAAHVGGLTTGLLVGLLLLQRIPKAAD